MVHFPEVHHELAQCGTRLFPSPENLPLVFDGFGFLSFQNCPGHLFESDLHDRVNLVPEVLLPTVDLGWSDETLDFDQRDNHVALNRAQVIPRLPILIRVSQVGLSELNLLLDGVQDPLVAHLEVNDPIKFGLLDNLRLVPELEHVDSIPLDAADILDGDFPLDLGYGFDYFEHSVGSCAPDVGWSPLVENIPSHQEPMAVGLTDLKPLDTGLDFADRKGHLVLIALAILHGRELLRVEVGVGEHLG